MAEQGMYMVVHVASSILNFELELEKDLFDT